MSYNFISFITQTGGGRASLLAEVVSSLLVECIVTTTTVVWCSPLCHFDGQEVTTEDWFTMLISINVRACVEGITLYSTFPSLVRRQLLLFLGMKCVCSQNVCWGCDWQKIHNVLNSFFILFIYMLHSFYLELLKSICSRLVVSLLVFNDPSSIKL